MFGKADQWVIQKFQDAYLWLLDWTGVRVGTLQVITGGGASFIGWVNHQHWLFVVGIGVMLLVGAFRNHTQDSDHDCFNFVAMRQEESLFRKLFTAWLIGGMLAAVILLRPASFAFELLWFVCTYLNCVKVRDREPKEFFERRTAMGMG